MFSVRHFPELATPEHFAWLRSRAGEYDAEGRACKWLAEGVPLPPELLAVARAVCPEIDPRAFSVLVQCYENGRASTPCHSDHNATGFGFILSLGATRTFRIHRVPPGVKVTSGCGDAGLDVVSVECVNGTAVLMDAAFHASWHHQVPPEPDTLGERLGLVFRTRPRG